MEKLMKMSAFTDNNSEALNELEMAQIQGGKTASSCTTETYSTNDSGCSDTENWIYDESGHVPIRGTITYSDGTYSQMYP